MSIVTVQLGQCGNQLGGQFFTTVADDLKSTATRQVYGEYNEDCLERFFHVDERGVWKARAVLVDTEPKVIAQTRQEASKSGVWSYGPSGDICERRGSGNNWACGFCQRGRKAAGPTLEAVRKSVEACDRFDGFMTHMSLAGGTGSGVGSYLSQCLRDNYPHCFIVNQVIWPYGTGEVIVQNYNAVLSLAHLYQSADLVFAVENDAIHNICTRLLAIQKVSFRDINRVIAQQLAAALVPVWSANGRTLLHSHIGDMIEQLVPHPSYKLATVRCVPQISDRSVDFTSHQWPGILRHLRQMLIAKASMEEGMNWQMKPSSAKCSRSLSNLLVLRGNDLDAVDISSFHDQQLYSTMSALAGSNCGLWTHPRPFCRREKTAVLLSNGQSSTVDAMEQTVSRAWTMFASRAYVHQYTSHGLDENDFVDCFAALEQILAN